MKCGHDSKVNEIMKRHGSQYKVEERPGVEREEGSKPGKKQRERGAWLWMATWGRGGGRDRLSERETEKE